MPWIEWRRRQRRLPTEYVEIPSDVAPEPLQLDIPAFGPDRSFVLPRPEFPEAGVADALSPASRPTVRYRLPQPPPMPSADAADGVMPADSSVLAKRRSRPTPPEVRGRKRVMLGESMGDVTESDADVARPTPESGDPSSR